jgi:uncharacterized protein
MMDDSEAQGWLEELSVETCLPLLRSTNVGRIGFVVDDFPVILPVNFRFIESGPAPWLALRTRPGNVIDKAPMQVAFEIDGIDTASRQGWSVLVRGKLRHSPAPAEDRSFFDSEPWLEADRDSWLLIEPAVITGRRLHPHTVEWAFHLRAYL